MYVSQITLYTLNLYSTVYQLYLNKSGRKYTIIKKNDSYHLDNVAVVQW